MRHVHPKTVRQFFALANQHMRWELNDVARRLDKQEPLVEMRDSGIPAPPPSSGSPLSPNCLRMLEAIESLPPEEREVFDLIRIQGMAQTEAAEVLGIAVRTVQRRLNRAMLLLTEKLSDLVPVTGPSDQAGNHPENHNGNML
jgi:RNA polymerase sigma-70 factor (ECF subfamily)